MNLRQRLALAIVVLAISGCVRQSREDQIASQGLDGSARWADGFRHKILGEATGTAHGAYSPLFLFFYDLLNIPIVDGGERTAYMKHDASFGRAFFWYSGNPIEAAARYDALQSVKGADVLLAVRVKRDTKRTTFGLWLDETVTVTGKAVQLLD